jgi:RNA polymerase sigma-70 factor (ECF subfamily)
VEIALAVGAGPPARPASRCRLGAVSDEDREAIRRVQDGDREAFEVLVEKYKRRAFRLAYQVLRDQEDALDVAQEAFVKAYRALPTFKGDSAFFTWLFRITMNLALDRKRQRAVRTRSLGGGDEVSPEDWERTAAADQPGPDDEAASAERRAKIGRALESLSEHHRSIIILSDIEGLAYREIAQVLGIPIGTVMSRLHHARRRLREALGGTLAALLVAIGLVAGVARPAPAQGPPPAAPAPAHPSGGPEGQQVCIFALVLLASNPETAGEPRALSPMPRPRPPRAPALRSTPHPSSPEGGDPEIAGAGCGREVRLRPWVPRLREVFGYSTFDLISAFEATMPIGLAQRFALPGGRELELQPTAVRPPVVRLLVKVKRGSIPELTTLMDVPPRRPALIGGPPHGPGVLIIAIRSRLD